MYNRRYDKVFLMLRQETAGYGLGQRAPWGSCVMEIKNGTGRISLTVQGLRQIARGRYAVYAIAGEKEKQNSFFCGVLVPDSAGHGELKWDFNPDRLGERAATVEDLNTVAVLAETDGGFSAPLTAYFGSKGDWRTYFKESVSQKIQPQKENPIRKEAINIKETEKKETEKIKEVTKLEGAPQETTLAAAEAMAVNMPSFELPKVNWKRDGIKNENENQKEEPAMAKDGKKESYHGSFRGLLEKFRMELEELQDEGVFNQKDMERIDRAGRRNLQKVVAVETVDSTSVEKQAPVPAVISPVAEQVAVEEPIKEALPQNEAESDKEDKTRLIHDFLERYNLLKENTDIYPFGEDEAPWKCISIEEMILLEGIPLAWMKDFFIINAMKKYHHLIWKPQAEGYSIGIPGAEGARDSKKAARLGFNEFRSMDDGALGYWIFTKK